MTWLLNWRVWAAVGVAGLALWGYVQTVRLGACQDSLKAERERVSVLGAQIEAQNAAVASLELAGRNRAAEAAKAAQEARRSNVGLSGQVQALTKALEAAKTRPERSQASSCPAGDAAKEIRRALAGV